MTTHHDSKKPEDQDNNARPSEEGKEKSRCVEDPFHVNDPDAEDPRLYSPIQEPDRPDPVERACEENKESDNSPK
jgi:hypothetical protein